MKNTVNKFGRIIFIVSLLAFGAGLLLGNGLDFKSQEIIGHLAIFGSLSLVYFAIKYFRDQHNNGKLSIKEAIKIGLSISAISGFAIGLVDVIYLKFVNPDFPAKYADYMLGKMEAEMSSSEFIVQKEVLLSNLETYSSPLFGGIIMFFTVLIFGIMITLISGFILRKN